MTGAVIWSSIIAFYRLLYLDGVKYLKWRAQDRRTLFFFVSLGLLLNIAATIVVLVHDEESYLSKLCKHQSTENLKIIQDHKVINYMKLSTLKFELFINGT